MNFNDPIDITAVNTAVKAHSKKILAIDHQGADAMLRHMTPMTGITDSYTFTESFFKTVSSRYTGVFKEQQNIGSFANRTLTVHPCYRDPRRAGALPPCLHHRSSRRSRHREASVRDLAHQPHPAAGFRRPPAVHLECGARQHRQEDFA